VLRRCIRILRVGGSLLRSGWAFGKELRVGGCMHSREDSCA
jgi:hypothetical protein